MSYDLLIAEFQKRIAFKPSEFELFAERLNLKLVLLYLSFLKLFELR